MRGRDAPKIINVSVWSAAVMGALAFSISLGAYLFGGLGNQISADIEQIQKLQSGEPKNKCASGTMYTINNYPGLENLLPGGHAPYYLEGDKNWRCSYVCVPDGKKLKEYLSGSTIGGKEITLARDPDDFNNNIWPNDQRAAMTSTVILSQSVSTYKDDGQAYNRRCTGPNSTDYAEIKDANKNTVDVVERQESTYEETEAAREELTTGASTKEGAPESLRAPTTEEGPCPSCQRTLSPTDLETTRSSSLS